jgi:hypothetical protein
MQTKLTTTVWQSILDYVKAVCELSPILFDIYMNKILETWQKREPKGIKLNNRCTIVTVLFADDQILSAETENDLQRNLYHLNEILKEYIMKISTEKTKVMATLGRDIIRPKIIIDDKKIEQVSKFEYLGCNQYTE